MAQTDEAELHARIRRFESFDRNRLNASYHGVAARLDRLPAGRWHRKIMWLFGAAVFCDCLDMYVGGGILAQLFSSGWSTVDQNALFSSITMIGYLIGALLAGYLADRFGRRKGLLVNIMIFAVATLAAAFSPSMEALIAMRGFMGIGLGAALPNAYAALSEYTPPSSRGRYAGWIGLIGNFSPPLGALLTLICVPVFGWRPIFIGIGLLSIAVWVWLLCRLPESPRWLASQGRGEEADRIVSEAEKSFAEQGIDLPALDMDVIAQAVNAEDMQRASWRSLFGRHMIKRTVAASAALFAMNLMVYTITNWTPTIFVLRGLDASLSIGITVVMLIGAPFGIFFLGVFADKHDRKKGLVVCLLLLAFCAYVWSLIPADAIIAIMAVGFVLCAVLYYYSLLACSVYLGEIFPTRVRIRGAGFANAVGRVAGILSPYYVAFLLQSSGASTVFFVNGIILVVLALIIAFCGVETRQRSLEDINDSVL